MRYAQFKKGQKVTDKYGKDHTVLSQRECQVFVEDSCNGWFHPSNIFPKK